MLPDDIRQSKVLTGNDLGMLGNAEHLPAAEDLRAVNVSEQMEELMSRFGNDEESLRYHKHLLAKNFLESGKIPEAWKVLLT